MKISSQTAVLCTVLIAATSSSSVEASSLKTLRNGRAERKRTLIKVVAENEESKKESEEMFELAEAHLARSLMSMSMKLSDDESGDSSGGGSGSGSSDGSGSSNGDGSGSSSGGDSSGGGSDLSSGDSTGNGGDGGGGGDGDGDGDGEGSGETNDKSVDGVADPSSGDEPGTPDGEEPSGEEPPQQAPLTDGSGLNAPTGEISQPAEDEPSSASSRNVAIAAIATTAMVVPLLL